MESRIIERPQGSQHFEYGCAMLFFDMPELGDIQRLIAQEDIYTDCACKSGLEDKPHCTLLYGLHKGIRADSVINLVQAYDLRGAEMVLHNASVFDCGCNEVLKFDVRFDLLHDINAALRERFPHTCTHPNYHPHATISYMKAGQASKYAEQLKGVEIRVVPEFIVYSQTNGRLTKEKVN